jgi:hypothetical protein
MIADLLHVLEIPIIKSIAMSTHMCVGINSSFNAPSVYLPLVSLAGFIGCQKILDVGFHGLTKGRMCSLFICFMKSIVTCCR